MKTIVDYIREARNDHDPEKIKAAIKGNIINKDLKNTDFEVVDFDLEEFKSGTDAYTTTGANARYITTSRDKILVEITPSNGRKYNKKFELNGKVYKGTDMPEDLFMIRVDD